MLRLLLGLLLAAVGLAVQGAELVVPAAAQATTGVAFDAEAATRAWIETLPLAQREKTDAYFEGGYWIALWSTLIGMASALLLLASGASRRMREWAERATRFRALQTGLYSVMCLAAFTALALPFTVYTDFVREHQYGLSNLSFAAWAGEQALGLALSLAFGALAVTAIYAVVRRAPRSWWLWGALVSMAFMALLALVHPVFIAPLFNHYTPVADVEVRDTVLSLARASGVPADEVWEFNASKQHKRISANVSGLGGTMRIALNDNLLARGSLAEIRMVMAHEIGHYVLNHVFTRLVLFGLVVTAMFAFARWAFARVHARWGARWGVRDVADPAGLPLLFAAFALFQLLATPVNNAITRMQEVQADRYGLAASREPDGFAAVALKLGEYRKMAPTALEEALFYTHPSGNSRITMAMRWKAEQLRTPAAR